MPLIEVDTSAGVRLINTDNIAAIFPRREGGGCYVDMIISPVDQPRLQVKEDYANLRKRLKEYGVMLGA